MIQQLKGLISKKPNEINGFFFVNAINFILKPLTALLQG